MRRIVSVFVLVSLLAGCTTPSTDPEESVAIRIDTDGPYRVGVPVPLHDDAPTVDDWIAGVRFPLATVDAWYGSEGALVVLEGEGPATLVLTQDHDGDTEAYLDAEWSGGKTSDTGLRAGVWYGDVRVRLDYSADSAYCGRTDHYQGAVQAETARRDDQPPQWFALAGEREAVCT